MAEYYDNETLYDNPQLERLNEVLDIMTDEELARRAYEVECQCEGLDPDHPDSPKRLKKIKRQYKWKHQVWPTIRNTACWILALYCAFNSGYYLANGMHWAWSVFHILGSIGWLSVFLTYKFGPDYIFKYQ